jgi:hypothetical protein
MMAESSVWVTVASAAVGSLSALGGVYLTGLFNKKVKAEERQHDGEASRRALLRSEGEVLYHLIHTYCNATDGIHMNYLFWVDGSIDGKTLLEVNKVDMDRRKLVDMGKIKFVINCYFPQIEEEWQTLSGYISSVFALTRTFGKGGTDYSSGPPDDETAEQFRKAVDNFIRVRTVMLSSIANEIRKLDGLPPLPATL